VADWYGAPLTVLHVAPTFDPVQLERMRRAVERTAARETPTLVAEEGDAPTTIVDQALSLGADLIVLGTHGHRGFKRLLLGSVTEAVLHEAPCPVLTVPPGAGAAAPGPVTFRRILCPIDFSPSAMLALEFALDLARQADGRITLLHVIEWLAEERPLTPMAFNVAEYRSALAADAENRLRQLVAEEPRT
jgi:nucleotide-binding universal stress UspA family protein